MCYSIKPKLDKTESLSEKKSEDITGRNILKLVKHYDSTIIHDCIEELKNLINISPNILSEENRNSIVNGNDKLYDILDMIVQEKK